MLQGMWKRLRDVLPTPIAISRREHVRCCAGVLIGMAVTALLTGYAFGTDTLLPQMIAPMGACAVLLFALPASPLAQPWSVLGGNLIAALVGITCAHWIDNPAGAAALAVALSLCMMLSLRCLHPPAGAIALTAVLGGPAIQSMGYAFALVPVVMNSVALLGTAILFHRLTGHRYPHRHVVSTTVAPQRPVTPLLTPAYAGVNAQSLRADLEAVLAQRDELLDIDLDDLQEVFEAVQTLARHRHTTRSGLTGGAEPAQALRIAQYEDAG